MTAQDTPLRHDTSPQERAQRAREDAHYAVHFANRSMFKLGWEHPAYAPARAALDAVMLYLIKGKWMYGRASGTLDGFAFQSSDDGLFEGAQDLFEYVVARCEQIQSSCDRREAVPAPARPDLEPITENSESLFVDGIPIVPSICPVVVLAGSNRDMGRQYAEQVLDIYGNFIFAWHAERDFSSEMRSEIAKWEQQLRTHAPEILEFAEGWAEGATRWGLEMDYTHALAIWTGVKGPARDARPLAFAGKDESDDEVVGAYLGVGKGGAESGDSPSNCSGVVAWGNATADGRMVAGATTDHDCSFQATIVAFPDEGNAFVHTPFAANSSIPVIGSFHMSGHPGMNSKGLTYVHHAGANTGEPEDEWGYGIRRGPGVFHILQFADTAREAFEMLLAWPVGDTASSLGSAGGLWADNTEGYAVEARPGSPDNPEPVVRKFTYAQDDEEYNFLYANNNALSPQSAHMNAAPKNGKGYEYSLEGGWFTFDPDVINAGTPGEAVRRRMTKDSECRNRFLYNRMMNNYGAIDFQYMLDTYRTGGTQPEGPFLQIKKEYEMGAQWDCSSAHRANAFTAVLRPGADGDGVYRACIGPANRTVNTRDPGHGYYYFDETAAFWEIILRDAPDAVVSDAAKTATERLAGAEDALNGLPDDFASREMLAAWVDEARRSVEEGQALLRKESDNGADEDARLRVLSSALRRFTRAHVRGEQVSDAIGSLAVT